MVVLHKLVGLSNLGAIEQPRQITILDEFRSFFFVFVFFYCYCSYSWCWYSKEALWYSCECFHELFLGVNIDVGIMEKWINNQLFVKLLENIVKIRIFFFNILNTLVCLISIEIRTITGNINWISVHIVQLSWQHFTNINKLFDGNDHTFIVPVNMLVLLLTA